VLSENEMEIETVPAAAAPVSNAHYFERRSLCVVFCFPKEKLNPPQCFHKLKMNGLRATIERTEEDVWQSRPLRGFGGPQTSVN